MKSFILLMLIAIALPAGAVDYLYQHTQEETSIYDYSYSGDLTGSGTFSLDFYPYSLESIPSDKALKTIFSSTNGSTFDYYYYDSTGNLVHYMTDAQNTSFTEEDLNAQNILGWWNLSGSSVDATSWGYIIFKDDGTFIYDLSGGIGDGTWSLPYSLLTLYFDAGAIYSGFPGGYSSFSLDGRNNDWTFVFSRPIIEKNECHYVNQYFPPDGAIVRPSQFKIGYTWSNNPFLTVYKGDIYSGSRTWTIAGKETITVPYGTVEAYKINYSSSSESIGDGLLDLDISGTMWVQPVLDIVKQTEYVEHYRFIYGWYRYSFKSELVSSTIDLRSALAGTAPIYFPHISTKEPWQTEIALVNTNNQTVSGTLEGYNNGGQLIETKNITLSPRGRRQITIANEFSNQSDIGYIIFNTNHTGIQGYTKFFQNGLYRTAIPAVEEINTSDIYISHIASNDNFWTGISLVNTTAVTKNLVIKFNDGRNVNYTIDPYEHKIFTIAGLFGGQPQTGIESAVISNANGIIGLELFGNDTQLDGLLLTDGTVSTIYYPHVADINTWWTGIVAYNPSTAGCSITITPYSETGTVLPTSTIPISGKEKYIGVVKNLGLDEQTAWFKIDSTRPLSGFELFGTNNGKLLAAYAEGSGGGAKQGVFPKIEKTGWTGIAFVNTEGGAASVTLTAYNDSGTAIATDTISVGGHAKVVNMVERIFEPQSINNATYVTFVSDKNVVGFQLNGSSDGKMLDGLPALKAGQ